MNDLNNPWEDNPAAEELQMQASALVLGDIDELTDTLGNIGAFSDKNPRIVAGVKRGDVWTVRDCLDRDGEFNSEAEAGALFVGMMFGDDKTSQRCRYVLAQRVETALARRIEARVEELKREARELMSEAV